MSVHQLLREHLLLCTRHLLDAFTELPIFIKSALSVSENCFFYCISGSHFFLGNLLENCVRHGQSQRE